MSKMDDHIARMDFNEKVKANFTGKIGKFLVPVSEEEDTKTILELADLTDEKLREWADYQIDKLSYINQG